VFTCGVRDEGHNAEIRTQEFNYYPLLMAAGAIVALSGLFLSMAAFQVLPSGVNAISSLGFWGHVIAFGTIAAAITAMIVGAVLHYCKKENEMSNYGTIVESGEGATVTGDSTPAKPRTIDFSKVTPANIEEYFSLLPWTNFDDAEEGDLVLHIMRGQICGKIFHSKDGAGCTCHSGVLNVREDKFAQHIDCTYDDWYTFSNLKDHLDHLFKGKDRGGKPISQLKYFRLKTASGEFVIYRNPYLKS
jgi:hypothetical protein